MFYWLEGGMVKTVNVSKKVGRSNLNINKNWESFEG